MYGLSCGMKLSTRTLTVVIKKAMPSPPQPSRNSGERGLIQANLAIAETALDFIAGKNVQRISLPADDEHIQQREAAQNDQRRAGLPDRGNVLITFHGLHEEGRSAPLHRLIERGIHGDAVIIGELGSPTELITSSRGLTFWDMDISRPGDPIHEQNARPARSIPCGRSACSWTGCSTSPTAWPPAASPRAAHCSSARSTPATTTTASHPA